jgi:hypothetical protein
LKGNVTLCGKIEKPEAAVHWGRLRFIFLLVEKTTNRRDAETQRGRESLR